MNKKLKDGVSVQELENFWKRYRFEIFFVLYFLIATIFSFTFGSTGKGHAWSIWAAGIGGILGVVFSKKLGGLISSCFRFVRKQEKVTKLILGVVGIVISFFFPPLVFLLLGFSGGSGVKKLASSHNQDDHS